jgi:hypothetical protein
MRLRLSGLRVFYVSLGGFDRDPLNSRQVMTDLPLRDLNIVISLKIQPEFR